MNHSDTTNITTDLYISIKGHVVCIDRISGNEKWRTRLRRKGLIPVVDGGELIFAYSGGHLYGIEKTKGAILWENNLPGLGHGYCLLAGDSSQQAANVAISEAIAAAQAAAAT